MPLQNADGKTPEGIATRKTWAINYDLLVPNPNNPRDLSAPDEQAALEELIADLSPGFDTDRPLLVKEVADGRFMTWDGNRRYHALGIVLSRDPEYSRMIPAVKVPSGTSEIDLEYIALRSPSRPLAPLAEANQIFRLIKKGQTEEDVAARLHKGVDWVRGRLELRGAPDEVREALATRQIAPTEARKLLKTPDPVATLGAAQKAAGGGKIRTRHVTAATAPKTAAPRMTAEQKAIGRFLAVFGGWANRKMVRDVMTDDVTKAIEWLREVMPA